MKTITLAILIALTLNAWGNTTNSEPTVEATQSEKVANCVEDYMDTAEYPNDMDDMDAIDYVSNKAIDYCESKETK